jgi:hypothetical protein
MLDILKVLYSPERVRRDALLTVDRRDIWGYKG